MFGPNHDSGLSPDEMRRYARHLILPEVGEAGQERLKAASVVLVGAGGLGAPVGLYLAAAGVGRLGLVDFDVVDETNLQRQVAYATADVGRRKLDAARERFAGVNPHVQIDLHPARLDATNALEILRDYDLVIDGSDNFPTRYLVNDACVLLGKPNVYGSIYRFEGQASVFWAAKGPCYRCLFPEPPPAEQIPNCAEGGVLGVLPGVIGCIQATEAIKLLLQVGEPLIGRLLLFDALALRFREIRLRKNAECVLCGADPRIRELSETGAACGVATAVPEAALGEGEISVRQLQERLDAGESLFLLDVRQTVEWQSERLPEAKLIPLQELPQHLHEVPRDRDVVVYCKMGGRSAQAARFLRQQGYPHVFNLQGGLDAWKREPHGAKPR